MDDLESRAGKGHVSLGGLSKAKKFLYSTISAALLYTLAACSNGVASATPIEIDPTKTETPVVETVEPTYTLTLEPTTTPELYNLTIFAFHDYNGNGEWNEGEPVLEGIVNRTGDYECVTDVDGFCDLVMFPEGEYQIKVDSTDASVEGLDFMFYENDVFNSERGISIKIEEDYLLSVALGQGPLPLPMALNEGYDGIYKGFKTPDAPTHTALDLWVLGVGEQPIYANISGLIQSISSVTEECGNVVIEVRRSDLGFNANINMGHLTRIIVEKGQYVEKGDIIGYINPDLYNGTKENPGTIIVACTTQPHVHYGVFMPTSSDPSTWDWYDPSLLSPNKGYPEPLK